MGEAIVALLAALIGSAISLWVKDKARSAADERLRELLRSQLAEFKADLVASLDDRYVGRSEFDMCRELHGQRAGVAKC